MIFRRSRPVPDPPAATRGHPADAIERASLAGELAAARRQAGYRDRDVPAVFAAYLGISDEEAAGLALRIENPLMVHDVPTWALQAYARLFGRTLRLRIEDRRVPAGAGERQ